MHTGMFESLKHLHIILAVQQHVLWLEIWVAYGCTYFEGSKIHHRHHLSSRAHTHRQTRSVTTSPFTTTTHSQTPLSHTLTNSPVSHAPRCMICRSWRKTKGSAMSQAMRNSSSNSHCSRSFTMARSVHFFKSVTEWRCTVSVNLFFVFFWCMHFLGR